MYELRGLYTCFSQQFPALWTQISNPGQCSKGIALPEPLCQSTPSHGFLGLRREPSMPLRSRQGAQTSLCHPLMHSLGFHHVRKRSCHSFHEMLHLVQGLGTAHCTAHTSLMTRSFTLLTNLSLRMHDVLIPSKQQCINQQSNFKSTPGLPLVCLTSSRCTLYYLIDRWHFRYSL